MKKIVFGRKTKIFAAASLLVVVSSGVSLGLGWALISTGVVNISSIKTITQNRESIVLQESEVVSDVANKVSPSVVSIITTESNQQQSGLLSGVQQGAGTDIIVSSDGYIVTNKHVVPEGTKNIQIITSDGKKYSSVTVIGRDPFNDLAFLKIKDVTGLKSATIGDSSQVGIGQKVVAIGNALGEYDTTVTSGIISGVGRPITAADSDGTNQERLDNLFQTDAAINPGNSGGPLLNIKGEVIGINTAVAEDAEGIGFAIPINDAKGLIKSVVQSGQLKRAYLGLRYVTVDAEVAEQYKLTVKDGAYVVGTSGFGAVVEGSPASKAGIKEGDVIVAVDGQRLTKTNYLGSQMAQRQPGDQVVLTILRDSKERQVTVTLAEYKN